MALHAVKKSNKKVRPTGSLVGGFGSPPPIRSPKVEKRKFIPVNHFITNAPGNMNSMGMQTMYMAPQP